MSAQLRAIANRNNWLLNYYKTTESKLSSNELQEKFGEYKLTVTDAEGDSAKLISHKISEFGRYAEVTLEFLQNYTRFCDHNDVDGQRRFNKFHGFLQGTARDEWVRLIDHGHEHWEGTDTSTNDQFLKALEAWTIMMTECRDPGNLQQQKLMMMAYKTFKQEGYLIKPTTFYKRWNQLWELSEFFPRVGAPLTELQKLDAMIMGVPQDWMEWVEKRQGVDVRDNANGGQNPITCEDLFTELDLKWTEAVLPEIKKEANKSSNNKRKRDDDDDDDYEPSDGGRKRHRKNESGNQDRKNNNGGNNRNGKRHGGNNNGGRNGNRNNKKDSKSFHQQQCPIHDGGHKYDDCIFRFGGRNFRADRAEAFAKTGRAPEWWMKTYNKKGNWWSKNNSNYSNNNSSDPDQQQQFFSQPAPPHQQQQFHMQQLPPAVQVPTYAAMPPPVFPQQPQQQAQTPSVTDCGSYYLVPTSKGTVKVQK